MEVYERINKILKQQNLSKREFATRLRNLEPRLKTTGEAPNEKTIYGYLSGHTSIAIELIPYIADALGIEEQSLFTDTNRPN
jgi:transcriptional regulator with XRE-family HTH domain